MKCAKCGAELKMDCLYCSVCGQETQIVSDTGLLEDEFLRALLKEETLPTQQTDGKTNEPKKKKINKPLIITIICAAALLVIGIFLYFIIQNLNHNSYKYQMKKAEACVKEKEYSSALNYYERALELKNDDVNVIYSMAEVYVSMGKELSAITLLQEAVDDGIYNREIYQLLIQLYEKYSDYDEIVKLKNNLKEKELLDLFAAYEVIPPIFTPDPGTYADYLTIAIISENGDEIFYTTDGSDPIENGIRYNMPIKIKEQSTVELKAVACDENGIYSEVTEGSFCVKFNKPKLPKANPDNGTFTEVTMIELIGTEGCKIYYTWDGTIPTAESEEYAEPIEVPEGDNILSVIQIDEYGMSSDVLKCNFKYLPKTKAE